MIYLVVVVLCNPYSRYHFIYIWFINFSFVILCKPYVLFYVKCIHYLDKRLYVTKMAYINLLI